MQELKIDPEFQSLIPPLSPDERAALEDSLKAEGCRDALVVWAGQGVLLDGHNRYAICQEHGIEFQTVEREFGDRDAAKLWIIDNQLARRNLPPYERGRLALIRKPLWEKRGRENMVHGGKGCPILDNPIDTKKELAAAAELSHGTMHKIETVEKDAPEPVKAAARKGDISTHRAYEITRAIQELPAEDRARAAEVCIDHDEKARILKRLHKSQGDPDSNGTYEEILRTGGFHYGDDLEQWCDFAKADVEAINKALGAQDTKTTRHTRTGIQRYGL